MAADRLDRRMARRKDCAGAGLRLHCGHRPGNRWLVHRRLGFREAWNFRRRLLVFPCRRNTWGGDSRLYRASFRWRSLIAQFLLVLFTVIRDGSLVTSL